MAFELPSLPYDYSALEPHIDAKTMELHHDKHHAAYVKNLNAALEKHPESATGKSIEDILRTLNAVPEDIRTAVRNHGGGHANHSIFWKLMMKGGGGEPEGEVMNAIQSTFGGFAQFRDRFAQAGEKHFGSGWVWLAANAEDRLLVVTTANQDSLFMQNLFPIMGNDLWEHAYYLKYQNKRADYLKAWWSVLNWAEVAKRLQESRKYFARKAA